MTLKRILHEVALGNNIYYKILDAKHIKSLMIAAQVGLQENNFDLIWSSLLTNEKQSN